MELELKHIACYLPYNLTIEVERKICTLKGLDTAHKSTVVYFWEEGKRMVYFLNDTKPYLRPLDDLTKEIEHKGKKFVPIEVVSSMDITNYIVEHGNLYGGLYFPEKITPLEHQDVKNLPFWIVEKLIEWHFDIYDLIPKGLALPKP